MPVIRAANINQLSDLTEGRERLGELVRRLVWNWLPNRVAGLGFLSGETNNFSGWDGWARLTLQEAAHNSLWEISVRRDFASKIRGDFEASLTKALPPGWARGETTYVAVSGRSLKNKDALEEQLRLHPNNSWADVQIIDAKSLEQWIEMCPAVEQWMGEELAVGAGRFGLSLSRSWRRWTGVTQPEITPALLLAGRKTDGIATGLQFETTRILSVQADSPEEAVGVVYSVLQ
jgi:hypothetical protein